MQLLEIGQEFGKNDLTYKIIAISPRRKYYLAELYSHDTHKLIGVETGRITTSKEASAVINGKEVKFKAKEGIIGNAKFGRDPLDFETGNSSGNREVVEMQFNAACEKH